MPRKVLLTEINAFDEPLFNPVWFSSQMWILLFDEELGGLARKIWNKYGMALRSECLDLPLETASKNIFYYLRQDNFGVHSLTTKAIGSAMETYRLTPKLNSIITDLISFYHSEWELIRREAQQIVDDDPYNSTLEV